MAASVTRMTGLKELNDFCDLFPARLRKGAIKSGLSKGAAVLRDEARIRAPKDTGKLARAIKSSRPDDNRDGTVSVKVRLRGDHAYLGVWHEFGTAAHAITAKVGKDGKAPGALQIGGEFVSGTVLHPGTAPRPFLRPAFDAKANDAALAFAKQVRAYLHNKSGFTAPVTLEGDD